MLSPQVGWAHDLSSVAGNLAYGPAFYTHTNPVSATRVRFAAARFAQKNVSILLDAHILREQARAEVSPFEARHPLRSPSAVSLIAPHRALRGQYVVGSFLTTRAGPNVLYDVQDSTPKTAAVSGPSSRARLASYR